MSDLALLPPNSTRLEIALDQTANRLLEIDAGTIRTVKSPEDAPAAFLPFLAWERGVDLWDEDWPEWKKRRIIAESYRLKGLKGTLEGLKGYLFYADAEIVDYVVPPQGMVARAQDPERIAAYQARFAQLRVYPFATRGNRPGFVPGGAGAVVGGALVARPNTAAQHYGRKAVFWDKGEETVIRSQDQLRIDTDETTIQATTFAMPGTARTNEGIPGRMVPGRFVAHSSQVGRMIVVSATGATAGAAIPPGASSIAVLNVEPETVYERHDGLSYAFVARRKGRNVPGRMIARRTRASRFIYARWYLFDEARAGFDPYRALGSVVGRVYCGLSPYRAHIRVNARFTATGRPFVVGRATPGRTVARAASNRIQAVGEAIFRAKALRDDIRFTTKTYRHREIGDLSFDQETEFGGMVPITRRHA